MQLELQATWSQTYTGALPFALPENWQLATHQKETYDALHDPDIDVVFDMAMTGDGKTLAAYLPMLRPHASPLGRAAFAYPTNELIRDQARQLHNYVQDFGVSLNIQQLNGEVISGIIALDEDTSRYVAIKDLMYQQDILLTNPDVFNLIQQFAYTAAHNPATLAEQFANRFRYLVFDEFHVFSAVQIATILDAMLFIRAGGRSTKFLFLSATPNSLLIDALQKAGLRYRIIEGHYTDAPTETGSYRKILQATTLDIVASEAGTGGILRWVEDKLEHIKVLFQQNPASKGLLICNSVFTAKKLYAYLQTALAETTISLGENTGLTGSEVRRVSLEQDLIVATSTVDIGVDFRINFLVFESLNAGSFVQRLGRLGRHEGFHSYKAVALLPQFIVERFAARYQEGHVLQRWNLFKAVSAADGDGVDSTEGIFPREQNFAGYLTRWGGVKAVQRIHKLSQAKVKDKHAALLQAYQAKAAPVFHISNNTVARARRMEAAVYRELMAFRGAGLLDVWLYEPFSQRISSINILHLLAGAAFHIVDKAEAQRMAMRLQQPFYAPYLDMYAVIEGYHDSYDYVSMRYTERFDKDGLAFNHAADRVGFYLEANHSAIGNVNDALMCRALCSCVCDRELSGETPRSVRQRLRLPPLFQLANVVDDGGANYTVAFGQDALLLDSCIHWRKTQDYDFC